MMAYKGRTVGISGYLGRLRQLQRSATQSRRQCRTLLQPATMWNAHTNTYSIAYMYTVKLPGADRQFG